MPVNHTKSKFQLLRDELAGLRRERDTLIYEKGLLAQDNKDLRENFAYLWHEQKEQGITSRISQLSAELEDLAKASGIRKPKHKKNAIKALKSYKF